MHHHAILTHAHAPWQTLIRSGACVDQQDTHNLRTSLCWAAICNQPACVRALLDAGPSPSFHHIDVSMTMFDVFFFFFVCPWCSGDSGPC